VAVYQHHFSHTLSQSMFCCLPPHRLLNKLFILDLLPGEFKEQVQQPSREPQMG
jgi:hypothetical protein